MPERRSRLVQLALPQDLFDAIERARGITPRAAFIRERLQAAMRLDDTRTAVDPGDRDARLKQARERARRG